MKRMTWVVLTFIALSGSTLAQTEFKEPWKDAARPFILDPFYRNAIDWDRLATEPRVIAIIHKASEPVMRQGRRVLTPDPEYINRRNEAKRRGYLWGSYHLGRPGDPVEQADFYLDFAKPAEDEVMALDLEGTGPSDMTVANATRFIARIRERTGRYPLVYITERVRRAIQQNPDSVFAKTPLWYARYCLSIEEVFRPQRPQAVWSTYTLWQFASEINCPTNSATRLNCPPQTKKRCPLPNPVPGTDYQMDVNVYNGTAEELKSSWPFIVR